MLRGCQLGQKLRVSSLIFLSWMQIPSCVGRNKGVIVLMPWFYQNEGVIANGSIVSDFGLSSGFSAMGYLVVKIVRRGHQKLWIRQHWCGKRRKVMGKRWAIVVGSSIS